jgi:hypothetical protein
MLREELTHVDAQRLGQRVDIVETDVSLASLNRPNVRAMKTCLRCQGLLG